MLNKRDNKYIKVAHIITRLCKGGAQANTFHTVRLSNRERFKADLISGFTTGDEGSIEDTINAAGIDIIRVPDLVREVSPLRDLRALSNLTKLLKKNQYDVVHTHTSKAGFIGRLAAKRAGIPVIVHTPHGNIFHGYFPWLITKSFVLMERHVASFTDRIITLTPGGVDEHLAQGIGNREQYVSIFSGIDVEPYTKAIEKRDDTRRELVIDSSDFLIGGVGRLESIKGFKYFVSAAELIDSSVPESRFILAGHGSLEGELREMAGKLGEKFSFLGTRDDVSQLMAAMDICVVPSLNEGMGRVILEAGAASTPVIATRVGGIPDIIRDGETGILVEPRDAKAIADKVCILSQDRDRLHRMGQAARTFVVPAFGLEGMVARIEELYIELLAARREN